MILFIVLGSVGAFLVVYLYLVRRYTPSRLYHIRFNDVRESLWDLAELFGDTDEEDEFFDSRKCQEIVHKFIKCTYLFYQFLPAYYEKYFEGKDASDGAEEDDLALIALLQEGLLTSEERVLLNEQVLLAFYFESPSKFELPEKQRFMEEGFISIPLYADLVSTVMERMEQKYGS